ncbi:hypothetical protein K456DRAFT_976415 [Colletotrichum gloeosporioides 23]|nr:hypothetical protein K456DRAFT_976415 [Colletotrichum gloeosporioides 23]
MNIPTDLLAFIPLLSLILSLALFSAWPWHTTPIPHHHRGQARSLFLTSHRAIGLQSVCMLSFEERLAEGISAPLGEEKQGAKEEKKVAALAAVDVAVVPSLSSSPTQKHRLVGDQTERERRRRRRAYVRCCQAFSELQTT